jgi:hypothetical protein
MKSPHILLIRKNVVELRQELGGVLSKKSLKAFDDEVIRNVVQLYGLGMEHLTFAGSLPSARWRQVISRAYYAAYSISKSVRLAVYGHYSQEVKDHDKVGELPDDFPDRNTFANRLRLLRDDRNLSDYDHTALEADLSSTRTDTLVLVTDLASRAAGYLRARKFRV